MAKEDELDFGLFQKENARQLRSHSGLGLAFLKT